MPSATTHPTPLPINEPKPNSGASPSLLQGPGEDLFLTPRVLDAGAFTEYTGSLKALLAELDARARTLSATSSDTDKLCNVLRQAAGQLKARIDAAATAENALVARNKAAATILTRLDQTIQDKARLSEIADRLAAEHRETLERKLQELLTATESRLQSAESRLAEAEARAASAEARATQMSAQLDKVMRQAATIGSRTRDSVAAAEQTADLATQNALTAIEQLRTLANDIRTAATTDADGIERRLGPIRDLLDRAAEITGTDDSPGTLAASIASAESHAELLASLNETTERNLATAEEAQASIQDAVTAAAESIESLKARAERLSETVESDLESLATEISPLERAAATLRRTLDELAERTQAIYNDIATAQANAHESAETVARALNQAIAADDPTAEAERRITAMQEAAQSIIDQTLKQVEEAAEWLSALAAQTNPPEQINQA